MRRRFWLLALLAFVAVALGSAPRLAAAAGGPTTLIVNPQRDPNLALPSDPEGAMRGARERVAAGDLEGAIRALATYVAGHPDEIAPDRLLGDLYYRRGDLARAESVYTSILVLAPRDKETHNRLGSVYATQNRLDDAIAEFNRSLPGTDSVPDLVRLHMRKGDFARYRSERERAAADYPNDPEAQLELGQLYEEIHQPEVAITYFKRALDDDHSSLFALNGLGLSYLDEHDYPNAIASFTTCMSRDAYNYSCADNLAAAYLETRRLIEANNMLQLAHRLAPERAEAIVNFGYLQDVRGDWKGAVSYYVQAMTVYPYSPDAYINLGIDYNEHGLYQLAESAVIKGLAVAPEDGRLHFLLGDVYERQGNETQAEAQFKAAAVSDDPVVDALARQRVALLSRPHP